MGGTGWWPPSFRPSCANPVDSVKSIVRAGPVDPGAERDGGVAAAAAVRGVTRDVAG